MPKPKKKYLAGTEAVLQQSQAGIAGPYDTIVLGKKFLVLPDVFSPHHFADTDFFARALPVQPGQRLLEVGPGTGVISVVAALKGADVVAVDINPMAVTNTQENASRHGVGDRVHVLQGDLYGPLKSDDRFDLIFWNTPFGYLDHHDITLLQRATYDPFYQATAAYIDGANDHLRPNGRLFIGFSSTLGDLPALTALASASGYQLDELAAEDSVETHFVRFELFEATRSNTPGV